MNNRISLIAILMFLISLSFTVVSGDKGLIAFNPLIQIEENAQNAIIAWNGTEEVLILSTDVTSSESTLVLELLPLPSNPLEVKEGSFESFTKLQEIVNEKLRDRYWKTNIYFRSKGMTNAVENKVEITFQSKIGAHNITIVKANNLTYLVKWANNFAKQNGFGNISFSTDFQNCIKDYLERGINFFVFDVIGTNETKQSVNPIIYRFKTRYLYYPLNITALSDVGESSTTSDIHLFLLTDGIIKYNIIFETFPHYSILNTCPEVDLKKEELKEISSDLYNLFKKDILFTEIKYNGLLSNLKTDLTASQEDLIHPNLEIKFEREILIERGKSKIVNITVKNTGDTNLSKIGLSIVGDIQGLQHERLSIKPVFYYWNLPPGKEITFEVLLTIPMDTATGRYNLSYITSSLCPAISSDYIWTMLQKTENATLVVYDVYGASNGLSEEVDKLRSEIESLIGISEMMLIILIGVAIMVTIFMIIIFVKIKK